MTFMEQFDRLNVTTTSPDGSVTASWSLSAGFTVAVGPGATRTHDDRTLAAQATAAVRGVQRGFGRAMGVLLESDDAPATPDDVGDERRRGYEAEVAGIRVTEASPRNLAKAEIAEGEIGLRIRPGSLSDMAIGPDRLCGELNAALSRAHDAFERRRNRIYDKWYRIEEE